MDPAFEKAAFALSKPNDLSEVVKTSFGYHLIKLIDKKASDGGAYADVKSTVAKDASPESFGHSGYTGTFVWIDPKEDLIFLFLSNRVFPTRESRAIYDLNIRPRIQQSIYDALKK
jgi:CubicO group peptidase (beta-lactamase class C family)